MQLTPFGLKIEGSFIMHNLILAVITSKINLGMLAEIRNAELHVSQCFQHALVTLLLREQTEVMVAVFIAINNHVFWRWGKTVLNSTIASNAFLVCARVEES